MLGRNATDLGDSDRGVPYLESAPGLRFIHCQPRESNPLLAKQQALICFAQPLSILLSHGVPCALSNDDPAVFTNHGLTYDTYQFFNNTDAFDLLSIQKLCLQSIEHTLLSPEEKATCLKRYEQQWAAFIAHLKTQLQDS